MQGEIRKYGTERCRRLLELAGSPDAGLKIIHIAGTNGKGSTAAYISAILAAAGKRTGTFTSPKVFSYEEQFCIDCSPIAADKLNAYIGRIKTLAAEVEDEPSPFEIETAAAIAAFCGEGCEYAVLECGLGGRDDATNAVRRKEVAVITSVSFDHTAELGAALKEICLAKSGIIKDCPAVVSAYQCAEVKDFFKAFDPVFAGEGLTPLAAADGEYNSFLYKGEEYSIKMRGEAQYYNAATAVEACKLLGVEDEYIRRGLKRTYLAGRIEFLERGGATYILDGAHNAGALKVLAQTLSDSEGKGELAFGCLSDKDVCAAAQILAPHFKKAYLIKPPCPRGMELDRIEAAFKGRIECERAPSVSAALDKTSCKTVVVCGSFTILKEAKEWINRLR